MKLVHWSHKVVTKVHGRWQNNEAIGRKQRIAGLGKPAGFWLSDESRGAHGWRAWCTSERFRPYSLRYAHEVKLSEKAKILYLRNAKDIDDFAEKYKAKSELNDRMAGIRYGDSKPSICEIDWHKVAKKYHGIVITPYIWEQRLGRHMWYYAWDCASGCIWNARAIESIEVIKEYKVPRHPTRWEEARKRKRSLERMKQATASLMELNAKKVAPRRPVNAE